MAELIICEKPSVATDVARALTAGGERFERVDWGFRGPTHWVTAAAGHLVAELTPEGYDERYRTWDLAQLPIVPDPFRYQPRDDRAAQRLRVITALLDDPDVTAVVNACDAGREGELIFALIYDYSGSTKPVRRAWFSSMTEQAIRDAFASLRPGIELTPLEAAARSRSEADWLVGMNATRAATCSLGGRRVMLSVGRVQTPTLALVVQRDLAIENFVVTDYFTVEADFTAAGGTYRGSWRAGREPDAEDRFAERGDAEALAAAVRSTGLGTVALCETRVENISPPKLFDLTTLQREANKRYGMTAAQTLVAAQSCYETHKVLSYPRTDSSYITNDMVAQASSIVGRLAAVAPFDKSAGPLVSADISPIVNDAKVTDHHGLLPTDASWNLTALSRDERRIFDLVAWRFLASISPAQVVERTLVWTQVTPPSGTPLPAPLTAGPVWFRSTGRREVEAGWAAIWALAGSSEQATDKAAEGDDSDPEQTLPPIVVDEQVPVAAVTVTGRKTKPPPRFTEASLLGAMATAGRLVDDEELAEAMRDSGLGTPATRAALVEKLLHVGYLERNKRQIVATAKGRGLILALGDHPLTLAALTGSWEQRLKELERCDPTQAPVLRQQFVADIRAFTTEAVAALAPLTPDALNAGRRPLTECPMPACTGQVVAGKRGWGCTSWRSREEPGCGFVIWVEQSGRKLTEKQMLSQVAEMRAGTRPLPAPKVPPVVLGPCPSPECGGQVVERAKSWGCDSWKGRDKPGCGYGIWKTNPDGTELDTESAAQLLAAGATNAKPKPATLRACPMPRCTGSIVERDRTFSCNSWRPEKKGCGLTLWKTAKDGTTQVTLESLDEKLEVYVAEQAARRAGRRKT